MPRLFCCPMPHETLTLTVDRLVHGNKALGRHAGQTVFVAGALPGETVRARITTQRGKVIEAEAVEIVKPSPARIAPRCTPDDIPISDFQHVAYATQLTLKQAVVEDQFVRLGKLRQLPLETIWANPLPWGYRLETTFSPTADGQPGYWSRRERAVRPAAPCVVLHPRLNEVLADLDLEMADLRKLTLRVGDDDHVMLAFETDEAEAPAIELDIPVSVALVLPDGVAATLIGDPALTQTVAGVPLRVSAGSFFHPSLAGAAQLAQTVTRLAALGGTETVLELFSGVGLLTHGLSAGARAVLAVERNPDAAEDLAENLDATDNVALYNAWAEDVLPALDMPIDLLVADCDDGGLSDELLAQIGRRRIARLIVSCGEVGSAARTAGALGQLGYTLTALQPLDMQPQTHHVHTVAAYRLPQAPIVA